MELIKVPNVCLTQSNNGLATSTKITCDIDGKSQTPIFTESTYDNEFCTGTLISAKTTDESDVTLTT